jgi:multiple sugar transport system substrate-binding protein
MIELTGMTWEHERGFSPMVATAREYERTHPGVRIHWEQRSLQAFADFPVDALAEKYDLLVIDHPHMGDAARGRYLLALDEVGRSQELKVLAGESAGQSFETYLAHGHVWALPIDAATQVASYRPDLLDRPPTRWDEVMELAKAGRVIWPIKPVDSLMNFFAISANRGTPCCQDGSGPLIEREDALAVLELMRALARLVPPECLTMNPIQAYERLCADERLAYCPMGYGYSNYARAGYRDRLLRFTNVPCMAGSEPRGSTLGGTGLAISARCRSRDVAIDYAFWVASAECQKTIYFDSGGQPGNSAAWEDEHVNRASNDFFRGTRQTLEAAYVRPRYDGYMYLQDKGGDAVHAFLSGKATADQTVLALKEIDQRSREKIHGASSRSIGTMVR